MDGSQARPLGQIINRCWLAIALKLEQPTQSNPSGWLASAEVLPTTEPAGHLHGNIESAAFVSTNDNIV